MTAITEIAGGLEFPEGPIAMADGSVLIVEVFGPRLTRVRPDGVTETIAEIPGGPNGAAIGPGGLVYVANNGGRYTKHVVGGLTVPGPATPERYIGGRIQTVDPATGAVTDLYTQCAGNPLIAPNDLVFDAHGGFYFTDHGNAAGPRTAHLTGIHYARADGSAISEVVFPVPEPNGIGLSPDGRVRTGPRRGPAGSTAGGSSNRASSNESASATRGRASTDSPASSCSTPWPSTPTATSPWPR